ncbi:MAG: transposase [Dyella sp.]|nr:transposase [Dyella sp.]
MSEAADQAEIGESARTTSRKSVRSERVEIITRGEPRRSWTLEEKRAIVVESLGPELTPTEVARKHAISTGQLYTWRRQLLDMQNAVVTRSVPRFAEVAVAADAPPMAPSAGSGDMAVPTRSPSSTPARPAGLIEVILPGGAVVRVDAAVDGDALRRVLRVLEGG